MTERHRSTDRLLKLLYILLAVIAVGCVVYMIT